MKPGRPVIEVNFEELKRLQERARQGPLGEEDCQRLQATIQALSYLIELIGDQDTKISQLRALLVKPSTKKTSKVLEQAGLEASPKRSPPPPANAKPKSGHGRNGKCLSDPFLNLPFYSNAAKILPFQFAFV